MESANARETELGAQEISSDAVIRVEELHKYYELGESRVHAVRGVSLPSNEATSSQ